jgi:hypothetical protein
MKFLNSFEEISRNIPVNVEMANKGIFDYSKNLFKFVQQNSTLANFSKKTKRIRPHLAYDKNEKNSNPKIRAEFFQLLKLCICAGTCNPRLQFSLKFLRIKN